MQIINPELLDPNRNISHQVSQILDFTVKLGQISLEDARSVWAEWVVLESVDETIAGEASLFLEYYED